MRVGEAVADDLDAWAALRLASWPESRLDTLRREAVAILASPDEVCFLLLSPAEVAVGFVEGAIRAGPNGPYARVEGGYVDPELRRKGLGQELMGALEQWCLHRAIDRLTSATTKDYPLSS